jgi:hypothetical protein
MNHKRGFIAFIAAFVFIFFFGFVWHGILMKSAYMATASHWRSEESFHAHFWVLVLGQAVLAFAFTGLYVSKVGVNCAGAGFGYGLVLGILCCGINLMRYATEPLSHQVILMWLAGDLISLSLMGAIVGAIYKPLSANTTA